MWVCACSHTFNASKTSEFGVKLRLACDCSVCSSACNMAWHALNVTSTWLFDSLHICTYICTKIRRYTSLHTCTSQVTHVYKMNWIEPQGIHHLCFPCINSKHTKKPDNHLVKNGTLVFGDEGESDNWLTGYTSCQFL